MCVGIYKSRENDFTRAVDLGDFLAILLQPGITEGVFGSADGNDFAPQGQNGSVFDDAKFF
jgi:hypothetical protein